MVFTIYGLIDPRTGKIRYIGCTSQTLKQRRATHECHARKGKRDVACYDWIRELQSLGLQPGITALERRMRANTAYAAEKANIAKYRSLGYPLLNKSDGGVGPNGVIRSPETRELQGAAKRGIPKTRDHRTNLAKAGGGKPFKDDLGHVYQNIHEAGERLGLAYQNIWKVLQGRRKHVGDRSFQYL